ncbi:MAG: hypothetical protein EOM20_13595 [Spartobacteria bacterium]|nr:hypothetical protein [Spartobacteria bacterium]
MMKKVVCSLVCVLMADCVLADVIQFNISGSVNKDLVYESGGGADAFGSHAGANQSYLEDGYSSGNGLPSSRLLSSSQAGLGSYSMLSYDGNNAIELYAAGAAGTVSYNIDIPDLKYDQLGLLVGGVNGDVSFGYTLNYADASTFDGWWEADDWYDTGGDLRANMNVIISDMDNVNVGDGTINDLNHFSMFEFLIMPDNTDKVIASIDIHNDPSYRWSSSGDGSGAVFAMNGAGQVIPEPASFTLMVLALTGLWIFRRSR